MKTPVCLAIFLVTAVHFSFKQANTSIGDAGYIVHRKLPLDTVQIINDIKKEYAEINQHRTHYRVFERDAMDESTEGGFIAAWGDGQSIRKITATYYGETGKMIEEFYFKQQDLIFVFMRTYSYNKPFYLKGSKVSSTNDERLYFYNKTLFKWLDNKMVKDNTSKEFAIKGVDLFHEADSLQKSFDACKTEKTKITGSDTVACKNGSECPATGFVLKGSRDSCGGVIHVSPKNKAVSLEQ